MRSFIEVLERLENKITVPKVSKELAWFMDEKSESSVDKKDTVVERTSDLVTTVTSDLVTPVPAIAQSVIEDVENTESVSEVTAEIIEEPVAEKTPLEIGETIKK